MSDRGLWNARRLATKETYRNVHLPPRPFASSFVVAVTTEHGRENSATGETYSNESCTRIDEEKLRIDIFLRLRLNRSFVFFFLISLRMLSYQHLYV